MKALPKYYVRPNYCKDKHLNFMEELYKKEDYLQNPFIDDRKFRSFAEPFVLQSFPDLSKEQTDRIMIYWMLTAESSQFKGL